MRSTICIFLGILYPNNREYTSSFKIGGTSTNINYVLGHKENTECHKTEILQTTLLHHNAIKLEILKCNHKVESHFWKLKSLLLYKSWVK